MTLTGVLHEKRQPYDEPAGIVGQGRRTVGRPLSEAEELSGAAMSISLADCQRMDAEDPLCAFRGPLCPA